MGKEGQTGRQKKRERERQGYTDRRTETDCLAGNVISSGIAQKHKEPNRNEPEHRPGCDAETHKNRNVSGATTRERRVG